MGLLKAMSEIGLMPKLSMLRVYTDSTVAKAFVATRGLVRMRHLEVKLLWLQDTVQKSRRVAGQLAKLCEPHGVVGVALTIDTVGPRRGANRSGDKVNPR
jgi:hypothetical protein